MGHRLGLSLCYLPLLCFGARLVGKPGFSGLAIPSLILGGGLFIYDIARSRD